MAAGQHSRKKPAPVKPAKKTRAKPPRLELNLALQGGGAHGAFTWGVLDRLLEDEDIDIVAISGTSAGAMNAAVMIDGYTEGGRERARAQLREFWLEVSGGGEVFNPLDHSPFNVMAHQLGFDWWTKLNSMDALSRSFSPYELNPLNLNPLRDLMMRLVNCKHLQEASIKLFVTATNVETGQPKIFSGKDLSIDSLMASSCIPFLFQAVEVDGVPYWDGGYTGNPAIWPLFYQSQCEDILLVQINPLQRAGTPKNAVDIIDRLNEITFNASLVEEMRAVNFVKELLEAGKLDTHEYKDVRMHMVTPPEALHAMNASTKMRVDWDFFLMLHEAGRGEMDGWLRKHKSAIGKHATVHIPETFLAKPRHKHETASTMKPTKP